MGSAISPAMPSRHRPTLRHVALLCALLGVAQSARAQSLAPSTSDTVASSTRVPLLKSGDLRAAGWALLATAVIATQDRNIANAFADSSLQADSTYKRISGHLTTI